MDRLRDGKSPATVHALWIFMAALSLQAAYAEDELSPEALLAPDDLLGALSIPETVPDTHGLLPPSKSGVLHVATRIGSTTYYIDRAQNPIGPEYSLTSQFAASQGWEVEWTVYDSTEDLLNALADGQVHLAAAGLTHLPSRDARFVRGLTHTEATQQLVCHRAFHPRPLEPAAMGNVDITVVAQSSHVETLSQLAETHPDIQFQQTDTENTLQLLSAVSEQRLDCTVVNSNVFQVMRRQFPHLVVATQLTTPQSIGWYFPSGASDLDSAAKAWLNSATGNDALNYVDSRYYTYISEFDFVDLRALGRRIQDRLPQYMERFAEAEANTGMPADLLAALSYQESHWDPEAVSPTGVRGIMMLTRDTADLLGVNRLDPVAAIEGGARYLADRHRRLPDSIGEPDRTFMALASYNVGLGHILDARRLAEAKGLNPDSWDDVKLVLPLKADEQYYPHTRYGYARGHEPVQYVQRIRNYQAVISAAFE